jgi:NAD+ kinase
VHPEIPAILITPICPHTLSFRPMLLPDSMELRICVPYNSRSTAWASFDGRGRVELKRTSGLIRLQAFFWRLIGGAEGDHIKVTASQYPFPTVSADKQSTDWFHSIARTLKWNERQRQKSFVVVEEGGRSRKTDPAANREVAEKGNEPSAPISKTSQAKKELEKPCENDMQQKEEHKGVRVEDGKDDEDDAFDVSHCHLVLVFHVST